MDFDFYKLQTAGNDIILVNYSGRGIPGEDELRETARIVCRRDYGIGGNGLIVLYNNSADSIEASFLTPSGEFSSTTADAAFCLSRYIFDSGFSGKDDFVLNINNNEHRVGVIDSCNFRISLGFPLSEDGSALIEDPDRDYVRQIKTGKRDYPASVIHLQKTGIVVFSPTRNIAQLKNTSDEILKAAEMDPSQRLIFATVNGRQEIDVHIRNSRGDDFSTSCAIAATASVVNGFLDREASIIHKKGEFFYQWLQPSNEIFLTGSPDYIFSGSMYLDF